MYIEKLIQKYLKKLKAVEKKDPDAADFYVTAVARLDLTFLKA